MSFFERECSSDVHERYHPILETLHFQCTWNAKEQDHRQAEYQGHNPLEIGPLGNTAKACSQCSYIHWRYDNLFKVLCRTCGAIKLGQICILKLLNAMLQSIVAGSVHIISWKNKQSSQERVYQSEITLDCEIFDILFKLWKYSYSITTGIGLNCLTLYLTAPYIREVVTVVAGRCEDYTSLTKIWAYAVIMTQAAGVYTITSCLAITTCVTYAAIFSVSQLEWICNWMTSSSRMCGMRKTRTLCLHFEAVKWKKVDGFFDNYLVMHQKIKRWRSGASFTERYRSNLFI